MSMSRVFRSLALQASSSSSGARLLTDMSIRTMASQASPKLKGKVAIVTASTEGIGLSIAKRLAEDGASVIISSRKEKSVKAVVDKLSGSGLDVRGTVCHVGKAEDRQKLLDFTLEAKGGVDILISNAAVNPYMGPLMGTPEEAWDKIFEVNVKASFLLTKAVAPLMEKRGGGSIVYVASIGGYQVFPVLGAYSISKTALLGLTKAAAMELASNKIRVNCVCPGIIKTKFSQAMWANPDILDEVNKQIPMSRVGEPDEIAGIVSFMASDDASYLTGESVAVAGGMFSRL